MSWSQLAGALGGLAILAVFVLWLEHRARNSPLPWEQPEYMRRNQAEAQQRINAEITAQAADEREG
jgi:hypothetical protein